MFLKEAARMDGFFLFTLKPAIIFRNFFISLL